MEEPIVEITNLRKSYGSKHVLQGVSLKVKRGEVIGYIGPNGAGKSTTIKIILGIEGDYTGEIKIFGQVFLKDRSTINEKLVMYQKSQKCTII